MSAGPAVLGLSQLLETLDQLHIAVAFTLIGILATASVCVSFVFRTGAEGVVAFYDFLARCAEARERYRRSRKDRDRDPKDPPP